MAAPDSTASAVFTLQGSLFISAQIERVFALQAREQSDKSYGLAKGENLKNKIATAYNICVAEWRDFKAQMERTDLSAEDRAACVERFAVRLFQYGLGYNEPSLLLIALILRRSWSIPSNTSSTRPQRKQRVWRSCHLW